MAFFPRLQVESPTIFEIGIPATLDAHNFLCRPRFETSSKTNCSLHSELSKNVARLLHACKSR
jgi:hypothetical protein